MKTNIRFYVAQFLEWEVFQTKFVEEIKTHILCSVAWFRKPDLLSDNVEIYGRVGQGKDDNMVHSHSMLDN
jgi:hypothetical protein